MIAERERIPNFAKKDSTGICFIGERPFREFLRALPAQDAGPHGHARRRGRRRPSGARVLHAGPARRVSYWRLARRLGEPWYVAGKDMAGNRLIVVQGREHPALRRT